MQAVYAAGPASKTAKNATNPYLIWALPGAALPASRGSGRRGGLRLSAAGQYAARRGNQRAEDWAKWPPVSVGVGGVPAK